MRHLGRSKYKQSTFAKAEIGKLTPSNFATNSMLTLNTFQDATNASLALRFWRKLRALVMGFGKTMSLGPSSPDIHTVNRARAPLLSSKIIEQQNIPSTVVRASIVQYNPVQLVFSLGSEGSLSNNNEIKSEIYICLKLTIF
jgi:hypothetical protein